MDDVSLTGSLNQAKRQPISLGVLVAYNLPTVAFGYMFMLFGMYLLKYSTDVLLIAPAIIGTIFGVVRLADAFVDPIVGYLSDRTKHRLGRRRPWIIASAIPFSIAYLMSFSPPYSLDGIALYIWMTVAIIIFYVSMSAFIVPHMSLGTELSDDYHERSRIFGSRYIALTVGFMFGLVGMAVLIAAEANGAVEAREQAFRLGLFASGIAAIVMIFPTLKMREPKKSKALKAGSSVRAYKEVLSNPHARPILIATFVDNFGAVATGVLAFYITEYILNKPETGVLVLLVWLVFSLISVPFWLRLARRFGKRNIWAFSFLLAAVSFGSLIFLKEDGLLHLLFIAAMVGAVAGCGGTVGPSLQGDVIDYDEYISGERKEGVYFAAWNFLVKAAGGLAIVLIAYVLQISGFVPKAEQTQTVRWALLVMNSMLPMVCFIIGALVLLKFKLNEVEYKKIRTVLDHRKHNEKTQVA